jgi:hypothetical protein
MPITAAAIGAGVNLFQGFQARQDEQRARKMAESEKLAGRQLLGKIGSQDAFFQQLQEAQLKKGHKEQLQGFAGAHKAVELGADAARRDVLNQGQRMQADATQGLISKGLIGTSAGTGVATDLAGQTTQQLASIDQQLASAFADLGLQEGEVRGQQSDELAQLLGTGRQFQGQIGMAGLDYLPVKQPKKKHGIGGFLQNYTPAGMLGLYG